ncbi:hypothetical protein [Promicromonospora sp. NPDC050880]|uniref:hypothetical protein n=1 Tax=Promicromonospora sp. NPDC050880 TaxID=3364406 RepID=UPI003795534E
MSAPYDQQKALADLLTAAGLPTTAQVPEVRTPPFRYVLTGGPWITSGQTLGQWRAHFRVVCVARKGTNETQMSELGDMVRAVIRAVKGSRFAVTADAVDEPAVMTTGGTTTLGAVVNITTALSRAEFEEVPAP